uniref:Unannotated protein n=1 Tax=freshwater metagenome TaxID=449393 RepID=A0A6J7Q651_9ZZZZ
MRAGEDLVPAGSESCCHESVWVTPERQTGEPHDDERVGAHLVKEALRPPKAVRDEVGQLAEDHVVQPESEEHTREQRRTRGVEAGNDHHHEQREAAEELHRLGGGGLHALAVEGAAEARQPRRHGEHTELRDLDVHAEGCTRCGAVLQRNEPLAVVAAADCDDRNADERKGHCPVDEECAVPLRGEPEEARAPEIEAPAVENVPVHAEETEPRQQKDPAVHEHRERSGRQREVDPRETERRDRHDHPEYCGHRSSSDQRERAPTTAEVLDHHHAHAGETHLAEGQVPAETDDRDERERDDAEAPDAPEREQVRAGKHVAEQCGNEHDPGTHARRARPGGALHGLANAGDGLASEGRAPYHEHDEQDHYGDRREESGHELLRDAQRALVPA